MGKENDAIISYLEDDARFADLFNHFYFGGKQVVKPEELKEASEVYTRTSDKANGGGQRLRDIKRQLESGACLKVLAVEAQEDVNYYMPWRIMDYDCLEYNRQIRKIQKKNQAAEDALKQRRKTDKPDSGTAHNTSIYANAGERLGKFRRDDRIVPVYTLCLYHGTEKWDGPRSLKDIMDFGEAGTGKERQQWEACFADYPMRLVCVNEISDCTGFQTSLGLLFQLLRLRGDRDALKKLLAQDAAYQHMDEETSDTVSILMNVKSFREQKQHFKEGDGYNMCQAIEEMMEESRQEAEKKAVRIFIRISRDDGKTDEEILQKLRNYYGMSEQKARKQLEMAAESI